MLKHVEQSVALAALRWFQAHEAGLAAMYAPHAEVDLQFRGRLDLLRKKAAIFEAEVEGNDPDRWDEETALAAFTASLMLKDALDAAGPLLLRRTHEVLAARARAAGLAVQELLPRVPKVERRKVALPTPRRSERNSKMPRWYAPPRKRKRR